MHWLNHHIDQMVNCYYHQRSLMDHIHMLLNDEQNFCSMNQSVLDTLKTKEMSLFKRNVNKHTPMTCFLF